MYPLTTKSFCADCVSFTATDPHPPRFKLSGEVPKMNDMRTHPAMAFLKSLPQSEVEQALLDVIEQDKLATQQRLVEEVAAAALESKGE